MDLHYYTFSQDHFHRVVFNLLQICRTLCQSETYMVRSLKKCTYPQVHKFLYTISRYHRLSEVYPRLSHKQVHSATALHQHSITTTITKGPLLVSKRFWNYVALQNTKPVDRKGNILTILMNAGLFIKLAMSKLNPVPVCKTIMSENYTNHTI